MKLSKKHIGFIISGVVLAVACMLLSRVKCVIFNSVNGWTGEATIAAIGFQFSTFLWLGLAEIALLLSRKRILRVLAVLVSLAKVLLPWCAITLLNSIGTSTFDAHFEYTVVGPVPYLVTALAVLSLIQMTVMCFVLPPKKQGIPE